MVRPTSIVDARGRQRFLSYPGRSVRAMMKLRIDRDRLADAVAWVARHLLTGKADAGPEDGPGGLRYLTMPLRL
jgi:hypothetical protein